MDELSTKRGTNMYKFMRHLSLWTMIGMLFVLTGGALVTKTDSGAGCGTDWPLCNGKFVPAYTIESMIEYSHRFVSGIVGLMVLVITILVWTKLKNRKDARFFSAVTLLFTFFQAWLGAAAVMWSQNDFVMATHFGFSLIAFASSLLLAFVLRDVDKDPKEQSWQLNVINTDVRIRAQFRGFVYVTTLFCLYIVYTGALIRHTESTSGCVGWPLCNGALIPDLSNTAVAIAFIHRIGSVLLLLVVAGMSWIALRDYGTVKEIRFSAYASLVLILAQIISGGLVALSLTSDLGFLLSSLLHTVLVAALFGILCYLCELSWQWRTRPADKSI